MTEKSIIRPTYSYLGNYKISDNVLRNIIEYVTKEFEGIYKLQRIKIDTYPDGVVIFMDVTMEYGYNLMDILSKLIAKVKKEIDRLTAMNILDIQVTAKGMHVTKKENDTKETKDTK